MFLSLTTMLLTVSVLAIEPAELLPGVWVEDGVVEFDAKVAMDCHHPETPDVFLEMLITGPDTREHESLLVSLLKPSSLHTAMLAAGFESGHPVRYAEDGDERISATGDQLLIKLQVQDTDQWINIVDWVVQIEQKTLLEDSVHWKGLVFAGSSLNDDGVYKADREGAIASMTPWGFEVISPVWMLSPEASVDEPVWIANSDQVPLLGKAVRVRIERDSARPVDLEQQQDD